MTNTLTILSVPRNKRTGTQWVELLIADEKYASECIWQTLDGGDWELLLEWRPQFADRCPWEKLTTHDWCMLLHIYPEWADKYNCPWDKFTSWDWAELLDHCPQFADKCDLSKLDGDELYIVFSRQPSLIKQELIKNLKHRLDDFLEDYPEYSDQKE